MTEQQRVIVRLWYPMVGYVVASMLCIERRFVKSLVKDERIRVTKAGLTLIAEWRRAAQLETKTIGPLDPNERLFLCGSLRKRA